MCSCLVLLPPLLLAVLAQAQDVVLDVNYSTFLARSDMQAQDVVLDVNYSTFLARSDLLWEWDGTPDSPVPYGWWSMAFTGNGLLGAMVTAGNATAADIGTLRMEIGRTDVYDDRMPGTANATGAGGRCDRPRLPIGYFQLVVKGAVKSGSMRISLWDAQIVGQLQTSLGSVNFTVLTHATKDLNLVNYRVFGAEQASFTWNSRQGDSVWSEGCSGYVGNPVAQHSQTPNTHINFTTQPLWSGAEYVTAYATRNEMDGSSTLVASTSQPRLPATLARADAVEAVKLGLSVGWAGLVYSHQVWWHDFYPASFITLADSKLEGFYWAQVYKLASATRGDKVGPSYGGYDHTGPWFTPSQTCCPLFNWYSMNSTGTA